MNGLHYRWSSALHLGAALLVMVLSLSVAACGGSSSASSEAPLDYNAAVQDAAIMSTAKISRNLTAITAGNANLRWENGAAGTRVLVATFIQSQAACESYNTPGAGCKAGQECSNYTYRSWVTVVPELKNLLGTAPALLRVCQALGLPAPAATKTLDNTCVLEFYVSPADLFRPSPDPEVTDCEAELTFPADGFRKFDDTALVYSDMPCDAARCSTCQGSECGMTSYRNWFNNRRAYVYTLPTPYPWTGLGYTYDWGNPIAPHMGLSEFVVNPGTAGVPVFIKSATWTRQYFAN